jgi:hypothetical protein
LLFLGNPCLTPIAVERQPSARSIRRSGTSQSSATPTQIAPASQGANNDAAIPSA